MNKEQGSPYRWVMAGIAGLLMTTSFISLTSFGILSSRIAVSLGVSPRLLTILGIDSFSIGLFAAFFLGQGGLFDTRPKTGILVAQAFLIIPQFLIPLVDSLWIIVVLRFIQGLMIMMLALFSVQLEGWFASDERAKSLAFTLGAITLGSAFGGIIGSALTSIQWQESYYITGIVMLIGAIIYFTFAKDSPSHKEELGKRKRTKHEGAWKDPMTWVMGAIQIPLAWTLFSIGGYLSTYANFLGYSVSQSSILIVGWGLSGFVAAFVGAFLGDHLSKKTKGNRGILRARLQVMTLAEIMMALGIVLIVVIGHTSFYALVAAAVINGFLMMFPPNYWALPGNIFPFAMISSGAFGMGLISNSADAIGPLVTSSLIAKLGWSGVFIIMIVLSSVGIVLNTLLARSRIRIPDEKEEGQNVI
ncbi:MAG: MFS transporter [Thermoplasmatales archaeon]